MEGLIHEKGMCKILEDSYKKNGYEVIQTQEDFGGGYKVPGRNWTNT